MPFGGKYYLYTGGVFKLHSFQTPATLFLFHISLTVLLYCYTTDLPTLLYRTTRKLNVVLLDLFLFRFESLLSAPEPIPLYALKLLVSVTEHSTQICRYPTNMHSESYNPKC